MPLLIPSRTKQCTSRLPDLCRWQQQAAAVAVTTATTEILPHHHPDRPYPRQAYQSRPPSSSRDQLHPRSHQHLLRLPPLPLLLLYGIVRTTATSTRSSGTRIHLLRESSTTSSTSCGDRPNTPSSCRHSMPKEPVLLLLKSLLPPLQMV